MLPTNMYKINQIFLGGVFIITDKTSTGPQPMIRYSGCKGLTLLLSLGQGDSWNP